MIQYNSKFPNYDFINNKGYGTAEHLRLLKINGYCEIHRKSFKGVIDK
jgi:ribonuclease HII